MPTFKLIIATIVTVAAAVFVGASATVQFMPAPHVTIAPPTLPGVSAHVPGTPNVIMEVMDPSLEYFAPMWRAEIGRRFDNAVGVIVHGGDFEENRWIVGSSLQPWQHVTLATELIGHFQKKYPGRTIVFLGCNTGHMKLGIPGVYYSPSPVWCVPDRFTGPDVPFSTWKLSGKGKAPAIIIVAVERAKTRWEQDPDATGNIFEFITD
jgi:hypothetical protein